MAPIVLGLEWQTRVAEEDREHAGTAGRARTRSGQTETGQIVSYIIHLAECPVNAEIKVPFDCPCTTATGWHVGRNVPDRMLAVTATLSTLHKSGERTLVPFVRPRQCRTMGLERDSILIYDYILVSSIHAPHPVSSLSGRVWRRVTMPHD